MIGDQRFYGIEQPSTSVVAAPPFGAG